MTGTWEYRLPLLVQGGVSVLIYVYIYVLQLICLRLCYVVPSQGPSRRDGYRGHFVSTGSRPVLVNNVRKGQVRLRGARTGSTCNLTCQLTLVDRGVVPPSATMTALMIALAAKPDSNTSNHLINSM